MSTVSSHHEGSAPTGVRGRTRVCAVGTWRGMPDLLAELEGGGDVQIVHTDKHAVDAAKALENGKVEVVLFVTDAQQGWLDDMAAIRERTRVPVVLLSSAESGAVLDQALEAGAAEALLLPQVVENVSFALRRAGGRMDGERSMRQGRIVTVFSPKGGIGKTVVATNLAAMFAKEEGRRTLLIDLDLQFGDTAIVLGLQPEQTLHDIISAPGHLDSEKLAGYATKHSSGLDVLPAPLRPEEADLVSDTKLDRLLEVARATYDEIVVDTAPFLHGATLTALDQTSDLLLIVSPEVPAVKDVNLSLSTLSMLSFPREKVRLIVNNAHHNAGLKRSEVEDALGLKVTAELPNDKVVADAVNRGVPATLLSDRADFTRALRGLTATLRMAEEPAGGRKSLWSALNGGRR